MLSQSQAKETVPAVYRCGVYVEFMRTQIQELTMYAEHDAKPYAADGVAPGQPHLSLDQREPRASWVERSAERRSLSSMLRIKVSIKMMKMSNLLARVGLMSNVTIFYRPSESVEPKYRQSP